MLLPASQVPSTVSCSSLLTLSPHPQESARTLFVSTSLPPSQLRQEGSFSPGIFAKEASPRHLVFNKLPQQPHHWQPAPHPLRGSFARSSLLPGPLRYSHTTSLIPGNQEEGGARMSQEEPEGRRLKREKLKRSASRPGLLRRLEEGLSQAISMMGLTVPGRQGKARTNARSQWGQGI